MIRRLVSTVSAFDFFIPRILNALAQTHLSALLLITDI
jgi:hypothetical protein